MASFKAILRNEPEELLQLLYKFSVSKTDENRKAETIARQLKLKPAQLTCAIGFNPQFPDLSELPPILDFTSSAELIQARNEYFINDIYKQLTLDNVLSIYASFAGNNDMQQVLEYLLARRLKNIEKRIDETVNSNIIDRYKEEMRSIYSDNIVSIDFVEKRLEHADSGFRALLNEVSLIVDNKLIPAGDIFFRDTILPQEKKKLLDKGLIPAKLIATRLGDPTISKAEKKLLTEYAKGKNRK